MLLNMHIKNIALIDEIDIAFEEHLNILTGETGAGKSIIIGSLGICLGGKFPKEMLRDSEKDGLVELLFSVDNDFVKNKLEELLVNVSEEGELLISRRLSASGRVTNRVNDETVTTAKLKEIAALLIDLHAQHEQQTLLKASKHLEILDHFGAKTIMPIKEEVALLYKEYVSLSDELSKGQLDEGERAKQMDYLQYQINEIEAAALKDGEDELLTNQYKKLVNAKDIVGYANEVTKLTGSGANSASDSIGYALASMKHIASLDSDYNDLYSALLDIDSMLNDFNRDLSSCMDSMEFTQEEFDELERRLDTINLLKSKYGSSIEAINASVIKLKEEYEHLESYEQYITSTKKKLTNVQNKLEAKCNELTNERVAQSKRLCELICESLNEMNFMSVKFYMHFNKLDKYSAGGNDEAIFMISTNVGEKERPLYEVASGGELSRVMLAIKSSLAYEDDTNTLVFDEIDVGISGRTAQSVANRISIIGEQHQVICITHLPQIASMANSHYIIEKIVKDNKTISTIRKLNKDEEIEEIARLLGGAKITDTTIKSAIEMKELANKERKY
ncbi:MAG: DNA repair protein RecN [Lachnospiraceae bacterium]|nr:DNA repair protein RecN [Lachnospiraceae bacterium]